MIAANRDEDHGRPTIAADYWTDAPDVVGGRDALHGGSWLAIDRRGRFAAVTNLRSSRGVIGKRSRGNLVRDFVTGEAGAADYLHDVATRKDEYGGFHLVAGIAGRAVAQLSGTVTLLGPGVYALSNADPGVRWPKVERAEEEMRRCIGINDAEELSARLMRFLTAAAQQLPAFVVDARREIFVTGDRYGTRSSAVILVDAGGRALFVEQSFGAGAIAIGPPRELRFALSGPAALP